jgi:hypothetical protein
VGSDGGVFSFGDATFYGSVSRAHLSGPIVGIAATPDGRGYWLVSSNGGVFAFGDAIFFGSLAPTTTVAISGIVADENVGYRLISDEGTPFSYGTNP